MSNFIKFSALALTLLISPFAQAEESTIDVSTLDAPTLDASTFVGTWKLITAGPKLKVEPKKSDERLKKTPYSYLTGSGNKKFNEIWKFGQDGVFELTAKDHRASGTITTKSTYIFEDNMLKIAKVGRPGKFFTYKIHQKEGDDMILRGGMEGYYTFKKQ